MEAVLISTSRTKKGDPEMKDETLTLTGWPAVPVFLMAAVTQVLTALVMSLPITWDIGGALVCSRSGLQPRHASSGQ